MVSGRHRHKLPIGSKWRYTADNKLRLDRPPNVCRLAMEATGQWPRTKPPNQRTVAETHTEAARLGKQGA